MGQGTGDPFVGITIWFPEFPGSSRKNIKQQKDFEGLWPSFLTFWPFDLPKNVGSPRSNSHSKFTSLPANFHFFSICYLVGVVSDVFCLCKVSLSVENGAYKWNVLFNSPYLTVADRNGDNRWGSEQLGRVLHSLSLSFLGLQTFLRGTNAKKLKKLNQTKLCNHGDTNPDRGTVYGSEGVLGHTKPRTLKPRCPDWHWGNWFPRMCSHIVWVVHIVCCRASNTGVSGCYWSTNSWYWLFWTELKWAFLPTG